MNCPGRAGKMLPSATGAAAAMIHFALNRLRLSHSPHPAQALQSPYNDGDLACQVAAAPLRLMAESPDIACDDPVLNGALMDSDALLPTAGDGPAAHRKACRGSGGDVAFDSRPGEPAEHRGASSAALFIRSAPPRRPRIGRVASACSIFTDHSHPMDAPLDHRPDRPSRRMRKWQPAFLRPTCPPGKFPEARTRP